MKKFLLFTVFFIFLASVGWGQAEFKWTGTAGDDAWDNSDNWVDENDLPVTSYPGEGRVDDIVVIEIDIWPSGVQLAGNITIKDLTIASGIQVYINTNTYILTVTDHTALNGIVFIFPSGPDSTSRMNITNLTVAPTSNAGIDNGSNVRMNNALISMNAWDYNPAAYPMTIAPVTGDLGNINAGERRVIINVEDGVGHINIGDIESSSDVSISVGNGNSVNLSDITSGGDVIINVPPGSTVDISDSDITTGGAPVEITGGGTVIEDAATDVFEWNGAASTAWADGANWVGGISPEDGDASYIIIIHSSGNDPVFAGAELECDTLIIQSGASLNMGAYNLTVSGNFELLGNSLNAAQVSVDGISVIAGDITTTGTQTYSRQVVLQGDRILTGTTVSLGPVTGVGGALTITATGGGITTTGITGSGVVRLEADGDININGDTSVIQLIMITSGDVNVGAVTITTTSTGNEGTSAAIYIEADDFNAASGAAIVPGGPGGQLCLYLNQEWSDTNSVVDGLENVRWHQHFINLTAKHLVYGVLPVGLTPLPSGYVFVPNDDVKTTFILGSGYHVYINDASITPQNMLGLSFKTSGTGFIEFSGTNEFEMITLESGSGGISLIDTDITVNGDFDTNNAILTLGGSTGSAIKAANITLDEITALSHQNLKLETTSGEIILKDNVGVVLDYLGDITIDSADKVTFSGDLFSKNLNVTSVGAIILNKDINTEETQTYNGQVELGGTGNRILTGSTVTLGNITGAGMPLTINGDAVLNGGSGISVLIVNGTSNIAAYITSTGDQTYSGAVTLAGDINFTGNAGSTVKFNSTVDGLASARQLTITEANVIFNDTVGSSSLIQSVYVSAGTSAIYADITTTGNQTYNRAVTLGGDINFTGDTGSIIRFGNTVDGLTSERELTITDANVSFNGIVGSTLLIKSVNVTAGSTAINANITTTGDQTYSGAVSLGGGTITGANVTLGYIDGGASPLTITGNAVLLNGGSRIYNLSVNGNFELISGLLSAGTVTVIGMSNIAADITTDGNQTYTGAVILTGPKRTITSNSGNILFSDTLGVTDETRDIIELLATGGDITVSGAITAYQLIARATGNVTVDEITIDASNTGYEGLSAAIFIEADEFAVTPTTPGIIIPGGPGGQLCLVLNNEWTGVHSVVDGDEDDADNLGTVPDARWHQHVFNLTDKNLVYGTIPAGTIPYPTPYIHIQADNLKTTFILTTNYSVYINDAENTDASGVTFKTSGAGFIEFSGTNKFEKITLESGSGEIHLVETDITVTGGFELIGGEQIILDSSSGAGSSINAANILLGNITAEQNENLTLTTTSGEIGLNGYVGIETDPLGDITVNSADKVIFFRDLYANSVNVTGTVTTIYADIITTTGEQVYNGEVTLNSTGILTLQGSTVTLGFINGNGKLLTITGDGNLNGGNDIYSLSVSGNFTLTGGSLSVWRIDVDGTSNIAADITTNEEQTYTGAVTLGGNIELNGTTVTLGSITGNAHPLTITGDAELSGGSGIGDLSVSGNLEMTGGSLSAATIAVTGTSNIAEDITTTGNQTYTGAVTLSGSGKRTISSNNGNIVFQNTLDSTNSIELSASGGDITVSGKITAYQLITKAAGDVTVYEVEIALSNTGNEGINAAIYVEAGNFIVTGTSSPPSPYYPIVPGGTGGQLCLYLNDPWTNSGYIDGPEDNADHLGTVPAARWHQHLPVIILNGKILYSFTEDSSGNGKLDRIRVQANVSLNGDFSGFDVSVQEYEIDRTKGVKGFQLVSAFTGAASFDNDSFYIYLIEKPEIDGGNTPLWSIIENTSLANANAAGSKVGDPGVDKNIKPFDTIPPRIAYTLTLPGHPQTYLQVTEPVVSSSGADISASFGGLSVLSMNKIEPAGLGYLFNLSGSLKTEDLARDITSLTLDDGYFQIDAFDKGQKAEDLSVLDPDAQPPKYPLNWDYTAYAKVYNDGTIKDENDSTPLSDVFIPPNKLLTDGMTSNPRRVTDVLVSMTPANTNSDNYFAWPVWARFKKSLNDPYSAGNDVFWGQQPDDTGIIWQFDGTGYLETSFIETNDGIELQARINDNLSGSPVLFWTTANIPAEYRNPKEATEAKKTGGLWLPNVLANPLYNYVPLSDNINGKPADSSSSKLFVYNISKDLLVVDTNAKLEFIFRLSSTSDLFIARLDIPRGAVIPSDWYNYIRPFVFDIRNIRRQRGGVTIMNNVINSDKREITYIRYHLTRPGRVTVQIYTLDGTLVKSLRRNDQRDAGEWTDTWDGTNNGGRAVARGMYFVRVVGPEIDEIRKIMVVK